MKLGDKCDSAVRIPVFFLWRLASLSCFLGVPALFYFYFNWSLW